MLNLRASEKVCTLLAGLGWFSVITAVVLASWWPLLAIPVFILGIAAINGAFYRFIARERGLRYAISMLPLHTLYYGMNVISAIFGWVLHILLGEPQAPVTVAAGVGMDLKVWPPSPSRPRAGVWSEGASQRSGRSQSG
jgi:hypothetical protein